MADTTPSRIHPLVQNLIDVEGSQPMAQFSAGIRTAWGAAKFLRQHRTLWSSVAIPALINLLVFVATVIFLIANADWFMFDEPSAGTWYYFILFALWWAYKIILYPILVVLAYFLSMMLAAVVASPFNEQLSERAEEIMIGRAIPGEEGLKAALAGGVSGILVSAATTIPRVILVFGLGLIPGIGPFLAAFVGGYFVAVEHTDYPLTRRKYGLRQKLGTVWKHRSLALGFGLGANILLVIPLLNFLSMPIAVVGGTAVAIALDQFERKSIIHT